VARQQELSHRVALTHHNSLFNPAKPDELPQRPVLLPSELLMQTYENMVLLAPDYNVCPSFFFPSKNLK
jgi:hypothetical protein